LEGRLRVSANLGDELLEHLRVERHLLELEGEGGVRLVRGSGRGRGRGRGTGTGTGTGRGGGRDRVGI